MESMREGGESVAVIMVVDDDEQVRKLIRKILEREGHTVVDACDGRDGCSKFRKAPADLMITDIFMPAQDGLETIESMVKEFPTLKIIAISGGAPGGSFDFLPVAKSFGAVGTLKKPFSKDDLVSLVNSSLGQQR